MLSPLTPEANRRLPNTDARRRQLGTVVGNAHHVDGGAVGEPLKVNQFDVVVTDMNATVEFYRRLGFVVEHDNPDHVRVDVPGFALELDSVDSVPAWNRGWKGGMGILGFEVPTRQEVDDLHAAMSSAGYRSQQDP